MNRVNAIYNNALYQSQFNMLQEIEKNRKFCNHTWEHIMDVARLMYIRVLEEKLDIPKDIIYATALMHDIGRLEQYTRNIPHEEAGARLCDIILPECDFDETEIAMIKEAVLAHRISDEKTYNADVSKLSGLLYWADKKTRCCFRCGAINECKWDKNMLNMEIEY